MADDRNVFERGWDWLTGDEDALATEGNVAEQ
jgi:hypothetical protein